jgi:RNA polymerase sigma factor (sigma-70 family)
MNDDQRVEDNREMGDGGTALWLFDSVTSPSSYAGKKTDPMAEYVEQMRAGRVDALQKLYGGAAKSVRKLAFRITRDSALADEVTQATFFKAWMHAGRYDARRGSVLTWLLCIARSRSIDALRNSLHIPASHAVPFAVASFEADSPANPEDQAVDAQRAMQLHRALARLSPLQRQLLALAYFRGATHEEIAERLRLPLGTVKSHTKRALATLRRALSDLEADEDPKCLGRRRGRNRSDESTARRQAPPNMLRAISSSPVAPSDPRTDCR